LLTFVILQKQQLERTLDLIGLQELSAQAISWLLVFIRPQCFA